MADEADVRISVNIEGDNLKYRSHPTGFRADVTGRKGPTPGAVAVTLLGVNIDLSQLTTPGLCVIKNLAADDTTDYVTVGIYDTSAGRYYPVVELLPGEMYAYRLSRNLGHEISGTASGTVSGSRLQLRSHVGTVNVSVEAFEK